jgi:hypothetical protein
VCRITQLPQLARRRVSHQLQAVTPKRRQLLMRVWFGLMALMFLMRFAGRLGPLFKAFSQH